LPLFLTSFLLADQLDDNGRALGLLSRGLAFEKVDRLDPDVPTAYLDLVGGGELFSKREPGDCAPGQ
jgi:hypothetical protein